MSKRKTYQKDLTESDYRYLYEKYKESYKASARYAKRVYGMEPDMPMFGIQTDSKENPEMGYYKFITTLNEKFYDRESKKTSRERVVKDIAREQVYIVSGKKFTNYMKALIDAEYGKEVPVKTPEYKQFVKEKKKELVTGSIFDDIVKRREALFKKNLSKHDVATTISQEFWGSE